MFKQRFFIKSIIRGKDNIIQNGISKKYSDTKNLEVKKALLVCKLSRYEFEQNRNRTLSKSCFNNKLDSQGVDVDRLLYYHELHRKFHERVAKTLRKNNIEVRVVNRLSLNEEDINWADVIVPSGGDGTFLVAASKILNNKKPVIGFNSDPNKSEGHLCLPKKYTADIQSAIERLKSGNFKWLMRSRIRTTLMNFKGEQCVKHLHESGDFEFKQRLKQSDFKSNCYLIPYLALNEVFMGESLSARVSHLEMNIDESEVTINTKSSGLCVSTGTGSTSWNLSINRLPTQTVAQFLKLLREEKKIECDIDAKDLAQKYNKSLVFDPARTEMVYTIRDLISAGVWPQPKGIQPRGFASKIRVKSRCYDAGLVIDGGISYSFNDGTCAILDIFPNDALRTVVFDD